MKDENVKKLYDLKGSMVKRDVKGIESDFKNTEVLKDKNFLKLRKSEKAVMF